MADSGIRGIGAKTAVPTKGGHQGEDARLPFRNRCAGRRQLAGGVLAHLVPALTLTDAGGFTPASTQVIELGAADLAAADHFDRIDERAVEGEDPFHSFAVRDLADRETLVQARSRSADADAFE